MAKSIRDLEVFAKNFANDVQNIFGNEVVSIALYGSAARGDYHPKKSDVNFLIILTFGCNHI